MDKNNRNKKSTKENKAGGAWACRGVCIQKRIVGLGSKIPNLFINMATQRRGHEVVWGVWITPSVGQQ